MANSALIPFGEWMPDQPQFQNPGSDNILNVLPNTEQDYGPMPSLNPYSCSLIATCQGAAFARSSANDVNGFAGDASHLYHNMPGTLSWSIVSMPGLFDGSRRSVELRSIRSGRDRDQLRQSAAVLYHEQQLGVWRDGHRRTQRARYSAVVRDFVVLANTSDNVNGPRPQRVWWAVSAPRYSHLRAPSRQRRSRAAIRICWAMAVGTWASSAACPASTW